MQVHGAYNDVDNRPVFFLDHWGSIQGAHIFWWGASGGQGQVGMVISTVFFRWGKMFHQVIQAVTL